MNYDRYRTRRVRPPKPGSYAEQRRAERRKKIILICLLVAAVGLLLGGAYAFRISTERNYADGLRYLGRKNYAAAEEKFDRSHGYRDADALSVYCEYAAMYQDSSTYVSGKGMLELFTLRYDTQWQRDIDALADRIDRYYYVSQEKAASSSSSKYTSSKKSSTSSSSSKSSSSSSGKTTTKQNTGAYNSSSTYNHSGTYNSSHGQTFNYGGGDGYHSSLRDDYDNPEDLYEDNKDWYEDEDEAWDEYYDD